MEPARSHTSAFLEIFVEMIGNAHVTENTRHQNIFMHLHISSSMWKTTSDGRPFPDGSTNPNAYSKHTKYKIHGYETLAIKYKEVHTTRLLLSSFRAVSLGTKRFKATLPQNWPRLLRGAEVSAGNDDLFQCWSGCIPIATLCPFEPVHDKHRLETGVQCAKHA